MCIYNTFTYTKFQSKKIVVESPFFFKNESKRKKIYCVYEPLMRMMMTMMLVLLPTFFLFSLVCFLFFLFLSVAGLQVQSEFQAFPFQSSWTREEENKIEAGTRHHVSCLICMEINLGGSFQATVSAVTKQF